MDNSEQTKGKAEQTPVRPDTAAEILLKVSIGLLASAVGIAFIYFFWLPIFIPSPRSLDIIASLTTISNDIKTPTWSLSGRVLEDSNPVIGAAIWAILKDAQGNRGSPPGAVADSEGHFVIEPVPTKIAGYDVLDMT
jgi:hypothetical protein